MRRGKETEIHLELEIEVAAGAISNPVCLHGFDTIPFWKVCQGVQERLEKARQINSQLYFFVRVKKRAHFPLDCGKQTSFEGWECRLG